MQFPTTFSIVLFLICIGIRSSYTKDIPNCKFEDTVDLTDAVKFANGSYLYADNIIIPPDQVSTYDYEEIYGGERVPHESHERGCLCHGRKCIKFCCHPTKEAIWNNTRECGNVIDDLHYDVYIDVTYPNGSILLTDVRNDFVVVQGIPCENAYPLNGYYEWQLYENGSLWREYDNTLLSKRDYCISPVVDDDGKIALYPLNCQVKGKMTATEIIGYMADVISIVFIILTIVVLFIKYGFQTAQDMCFIFFLASMAIGNIILTTGSLSDSDYSHTQCSFIGFSGYFFSMSSFFWLNIMGYDLLQMSKWLMYEGKEHFFKYSAYAWGIPAALTGILIVIQRSNVSEYYRPIVGDYLCWINVYNWSALLYFYSINIVIFCLNLFFYLLTDYNIKTAWDQQLGRNLIRPFHKSSSEYGLLLLIMGISWIFDTFSYLENVLHPGSDSVWFFVSDLADALPGILIFICFALKPALETLRNGGSRFTCCFQRGVPYERELNTEFERSTVEIMQN